MEISIANCSLPKFQSKDKPCHTIICDTPKGRFLFGIIELCLLLLLLQGCRGNGNNAKDNVLLKNNGKGSEIHIGNAVNPSSNCLQVVDDGMEDVLAYLHENRILLYNKENGTLIREIKFETMGPNGVGHMRGFYIHSSDSIFILSGSPWVICLANNAGEVKHRFKVNEIRDVPEQPNLMPDIYRSNNCVIESGNKLHFSTYLREFLHPKGVAKKSVGITIDLNNSAIGMSDVFYPEDDLVVSFYSRDFGDGKWVYSFYDKNIVYELLTGGGYVSHLCKSKYAPDEFPEYIISQNMDDCLKNTLSIPKYSNLIFDPWRNCFYRFFQIQEEVAEGKETSFYMSQLENRSNFSVMILDNELNVIGETLMPPNTFNPQLYYLDEEGLHFAVSINHPTFDPDLLRFECFVLDHN